MKIQVSPNGRRTTQAATRLSMWVITVAIAAGFALSSTGCATKGSLRDEIAALRAEMAASEDRMTAAIADAQNSSDDAMTRAEIAFGQAGEARDLALGNAGFQEMDQYTVHFGFDSAELSDDAMNQLRDAAMKIGENSRYLVDIYGFTDSRGSAEYNQVLGQRRADAVLRFLLSQNPGQLSRFAVVSFGEEQLVAGDSDASRRVVVSLVARVPQEQPQEEEISLLER